MATKRPQVLDLRAEIETNVVGSGELGIPLSTLNLWSRGAVPKGAPPFPLPIKVVGSTRLFYRPDVEAWIATHGTLRGR